MKKIRIIKSNLNEEGLKNTFIKVSTTGIILSTLLGGCEATPSDDFITPDLVATTPTEDPTLAPMPSPTSNPTVEPTPTLIPTPTPSPEIVLSPKDDLCRMRDDDDITDYQLRHEISIAYLKTNNKSSIILYETGPVYGKKGYTGYSDFFTMKVLFYESEKTGMVPTEVMNEKGKTKWISGDSIRIYMIEILKMSQGRAEEELAKIKKGKDLREWYEKYVPKNEQVIISWEDLIGLKSNDISESDVVNKVLELEKYRSEHKILV